MMARNLAGRLEKLEEGAGGGDAAPFYILWINPGEDRVAALRSAKAAGTIPPGIASYCAEWKTPKIYLSQERALGPRTRSRVTDCWRLSDEETKIIGEAFGDDPEIRAMVASGQKEIDARTRDQLRECSYRDLIGIIICGEGGNGRRADH